MNAIPTEIETGDQVEAHVPPKWPAEVALKLRQIYPNRFDIPIATLVSMVDTGLIDLSPDFQRRLRWTARQKSRLIESVIMNVPIPPVFMGEDVPGRWVVLDGRQRLTALYEFLSNRIKLSGLEVWHEINGKKFKDLAKLHAEEPGREGVKVALDVAVTRRFLPAIVVLHNSSPEVKYEVFDRLNTGGVIAEAMEVRNAIYRGLFNTLIHELAATKTFRTLWGIPADSKRRNRNSAFKKMVDLEMVLRYFAMERYKEFGGRLKDFLTHVMSEYDHGDALLMSELRQRFVRATGHALLAFGETAFQRVLDNGERSSMRSAPLADAILYSMARITADQAANDGPFYRSAIDDLAKRDLKFQKAVSVGTNSTTATKYRIEAAYRALVERIPVEDVVLDTEFSKELEASEPVSTDDE